MSNQMRGISWDRFWEVVGEKKSVRMLDDSSIFHYGVKEYYGYRPEEKVPESVKKQVREMERHSEEFYALEHLIRKREKEYKEYARVVH